MSGAPEPEVAGRHWCKAQGHPTTAPAARVLPAVGSLRGRMRPRAIKPRVLSESRAAERYDSDPHAKGDFFIKRSRALAAGGARESWCATCVAARRPPKCEKKHAATLRGPGALTASRTPPRGAHQLILS